MDPWWGLDPESVRGFLPREEGSALAEHALSGARLGPGLEIGSYCGRSTLCLAAACAEAGSVLFALDHHQGSEEHQPGEAYHDPDLLERPLPGESPAQRVDTFPWLRQTLRRAGAEPFVIPIVAPSARLAPWWRQPLGFLFIDGGHSEAAVWQDYRGFAGHILPGGRLLVHDIYDSAQEGGQAPRAVWEAALASGLFRMLARVGSLGVAVRL